MPRGCEALTWLKYGQDEIPASLGITVGSEAQVSTQWRRLFKSVGIQVLFGPVWRSMGNVMSGSGGGGAHVEEVPAPQSINQSIKRKCLRRVRRSRACHVRVV